MIIMITNNSGRYLQPYVCMFFKKLWYCGRVGCVEKWNSTKKIGGLKKEKKTVFFSFWIKVLLPIIL